MGKRIHESHELQKRRVFSWKWRSSGGKAAIAELGKFSFLSRSLRVDDSKSK